MSDEIDPFVPADVRDQIAGLIRAHRASLAGDLAGALAAENEVEVGAAVWRHVADHIVDLLAVAVQSGELDARTGALADLDRLTRGALTRVQVFASVYLGERIVLDELALDERLGATSDPWGAVAHFVRQASFSVLAAYSEALGATPAHGAVRDALTTLIARPVFELALTLEVHRSQRHQLPLALILFDVENLAKINADYGHGVGDRLLERMGILVRRFFRTHDWVARHSDDCIVALLPQTSLDDAADLASRVRNMVEQRLAFVDHKTNTKVAVKLSAAAVGSDFIESELDPFHIMAEAEEAVERAKLTNQVERVALLPKTVSLLGAANLLGCRPISVRRLVRRGELAATRKGRHYHIDRASVERLRVEEIARRREQAP